MVDKFVGDVTVDATPQLADQFLMVTGGAARLAALSTMLAQHTAQLASHGASELGYYDIVKDFGAPTDETTDATTAINAAITAAAAAGGGVAFLNPRYRYVAEGIELRNGVILTSLLPHWQYLAGGQQAAEIIVPGSGIGITTVAGGAVAAGVDGINVRGPELAAVAQGIVLPSGSNMCVIRNCHVHGFSEEGIKLAAGTIACVVQRVLATSCLMDRSRAAIAGVVDADGADHLLEWIEANAGMDIDLATISSADLRVAGIVARYASGWLQKCIGEYADVGLYVVGSDLTVMGCRGDHNYANGYVVASTVSRFLGCHALQNSLSGDGVYSGWRAYDHPSFAVSGQNTFLGCSANSLTTPRHKHGFEDGISSYTTQNQYFGCPSSGSAQKPYSGAAFAGSGFHFIGGGQVAFASGDATPSVAGRVNWHTNNATPTTITDFDDATPGLRISVRAGDANTTVAHNANIVLLGGVNLALVSGRIYEFEDRDGVWYQLGYHDHDGVYATAGHTHGATPGSSLRYDAASLGLPTAKARQDATYTSGSPTVTIPAGTGYDEFESDIVGKWIMLASARSGMNSERAWITTVAGRTSANEITLTEAPTADMPAGSGYITWAAKSQTEMDAAIAEVKARGGGVIVDQSPGRFLDDLDLDLRVGYEGMGWGMTNVCRVSGANTPFVKNVVSAGGRDSIYNSVRKATFHCNSRLAGMGTSSDGIFLDRDPDNTIDAADERFDTLPVIDEVEVHDARGNGLRNNSARDARIGTLQVLYAGENGVYLGQDTSIVALSCGVIGKSGVYGDSSLTSSCYLANLKVWYCGQHPDYGSAADGAGLNLVGSRGVTVSNMIAQDNTAQAVVFNGAKYCRVENLQADTNSFGGGGYPVVDFWDAINCGVDGVEAWDRGAAGSFVQTKMLRARSNTLGGYLNGDIRDENGTPITDPLHSQHTDNAGNEWVINNERGIQATTSVANGGTFTPNPYDGRTAILTLNGNCTIANPAAKRLGMELEFVFSNAAASTITWGSEYKGPKSLSATINQKNVITFRCDGTNWIQTGSVSGIT